MKIMQVLLLRKVILRKYLTKLKQIDQTETDCIANIVLALCFVIHKGRYSFKPSWNI